MKLHQAFTPIHRNGFLHTGLQALGAHGFRFTLQSPNWADLERRAEAVGLDPEPLRRVKEKADVLDMVCKRTTGGAWISQDHILNAFGKAQTEVNTLGNECHRAYDGLAARILGDAEPPERLA